MVGVILLRESPENGDEASTNLPWDGHACLAHSAHELRVLLHCRHGSAAVRMAHDQMPVNECQICS